MTNKQTKDQFLLALNSNAYLNMCESSDMMNAINALDKQIPKKVVSEGDDESDWVYCPCCDEILGVNESVYEDFYNNNWHPIYCRRCGQCLIYR